MNENEKREKIKLSRLKTVNQLTIVNSEQKWKKHTGKKTRDITIEGGKLIELDVKCFFFLSFIMLDNFYIGFSNGVLEREVCLLRIIMILMVDQQYCFVMFFCQYMFFYRLCRSWCNLVSFFVDTFLISIFHCVANEMLLLHKPRRLIRDETVKGTKTLIEKALRLGLKNYNVYN